MLLCNSVTHNTSKLRKRLETIQLKISEENCIVKFTEAAFKLKVFYFCRKFWKRLFLLISKTHWLTSFMNDFSQNFSPG